MAASYNNEYGVVSISQKVISDLASNVAAKCYGVVGMGSRNKKDGIVKLLKSDNMNKGIEVKKAEDGFLIDLHIIVQYGVNIEAVCESVVSRVRYNIEKYLGIKLKKVTVKVEGIRVSE